MKIRYTKKEINILCIGYLLEHKKILQQQGKKYTELEQIINQLNDRLDRQARRKN